MPKMDLKQMVRGLHAKQTSKLHLCVDTMKILDTNRELLVQGKDIPVKYRVRLHSPGRDPITATSTLGFDQAIGNATRRLERDKPNRSLRKITWEYWLVIDRAVFPIPADWAEH